MSKADQLRKMREQQFEERRKAHEQRAKDPPRVEEGRPPKKLTPPPVPVAAPSEPTPTPVRRVDRALAAMGPRKLGPDEGRCTGCGKVRAIRNGKVVSHQKGLGTKCPGAGKEPQ